MNATFWILLISFHAAIANKTSYRNHPCSPSSYAKICILDYQHYYSKDTDVVHSFPQNQSHIRIVSTTLPVGNMIEVLHVDAKFYALLGRPAVLEVLAVIVVQLELPRALRHGSFPQSYVTFLTVESGVEVPAITYLDLTDNNLRNMSNFEGLVNLEVLLLSNNLMESIDPSTFKNMNKLRYLDLGYNDFSRMSLDIFPKSLIHLDLMFCEITSLKYDDLYYPEVEMLNIEGNQLTSINGAALLLAMPQLRMARIGWNNFEPDDEDFQRSVQLFFRHNISVRNEVDDAVCMNSLHDEVCLLEPEYPTTWKELKILVVILIAIAMFALMRWMFIAMNRK